MAKRYVVWLSVVSIVLFAGCENKELIQCQQDQQALKTKFDSAQKNTEKMVTTLIEASQLEQVKVKSLEEQVAAANDNLLKSQSKAKKSQAEISQLTKRIGDQKKQLDQLQAKTQEAQTFLQSVLAENEKLKAQIQELQAQQAKAAETVAPDQQ